MKKNSFGFALIICVGMLGLLLVRCKKDKTIPLQNSNQVAEARNSSPPPPPADPAIVYIGSVGSGHTKSSGLMVMNADGSNQTFVASGGGIPAWSPNGKSVLFSTTINNQSGLGLVDISVVSGKATGSNLRLVPIRSPYGPNAGARWSPSGDSIVFTTVDDKNVYTVSISDGGWRNAYTSPTGFMPFDPDWSPDGTKVAFDEWNDAWTQSSLKVLDLTTGAITTVVPFGNYLIYTPVVARWQSHCV